MIINKISTTEKEKLYQALYGYVSSLVKRGISILCVAHSNKFGSIDVEVSGKRGIARKSIVIAYDGTDNTWVGITDGLECRMDSLSEITVLVRNAINKITPLVSKM